ncbi:MAG: TetR/AcrR family transcriptional regulator [Actinomycetales bacterium]|nr:TetR/AcrR family transcriptional regulator [Actinomycetales bacterium]
MSKSLETRAQILEVALRSFRDRGYAKTTMRQIANEADVALGNAYYYFPSKGHLIQELYATVVAEQADRATQALAQHRRLADRIAAAWHAAIDASEPYHSFGAEFISEAIRPSSPSSPFSDESHGARGASQDVYQEVVAGAHPAVPGRLRADLPLLLWFAQLGIEIFWVYDSSADRRRTRALVAGAAPLVASLVSLARLPVARGIVDEALALLHRVRS